MSILAENPVTAIPAGTWQIDPAHSSVEFEIRHLGLAKVKGRAPIVEGTIVGGAEPSVQGTVDVSSITTFDESRDGHLQSPDFFDTQRYPALRFASSSVTLESGVLAVTGELTIKGVTKPVTLTGELVGTGADPWGKTISFPAPAPKRFSPSLSQNRPASVSQPLSRLRLVS